MAGPGRYVPDVTEGIVRVEDRAQAGSAGEGVRANVLHLSAGERQTRTPEPPCVPPSLVTKGVLIPATAGRGSCSSFSVIGRKMGATR